MSSKRAALVVLFFFLFKSINSEPQCTLPSEKYRFDCFPDDNATAEKCEARGCCWDKATLTKPQKRVKISSNSSSIADPPLDVPYCFFPLNYGYKLASKEETKTGFKLGLVREGSDGPYGGDVKNLAVDVLLEDQNRFHFKIYDPANKRYEVPIPTPSVSEKSAAQNYDVSFTTFPFGIAVTRKSTGTVVFNSTAGGMIFEDQFLQISSFLPSSNLYGIGEHVDPLKLNVSWRMATLFSRDVATPEGLKNNLYGVHPFYLSLENDGNANGVFLLNSNAMEIILQPTPAITFRSIGGILDFYVFLGPTPEMVVQQYTEVVGRPLLPPYWGLGFHLCRWGYGSLNGTITVNDNMRAKGIPQDVQWNDIEYMREHLDFTVDSNKWGGLGDFVKKLQTQYNQHYIPIVDPGISNVQPSGSYKPYSDGLKMGVFVNSTNGGPIVGKVWPGNTVFPDFLNPASLDYWKTQISEFHQVVPFDGLWIDMNEPSNFVEGSISGCPKSKWDNPPYTPHIIDGKLNSKTVCMSAKHYGHRHYDVHSLYGYTEAVATMRALESVRGKRSMVISRSTYPNSGQHGGHWLGDNHANWDNLRLSVPGILNFNLFGIPLVGADICGFNGDTTLELCARWTQLGAFYPFSRNHNTINAKPQDPAAFGDSFAAMARTVLLMRYQLLPYLYTLFVEASLSGKTVATPLFFEFPKDSNTLAIDQQFLWGSSLLITPVLQQGASSVTGYFPDATWYDAYEGAKLQQQGSGGQQHTLNCSMLCNTPLHIRGGSIFPVQQAAITTVESRKNPFGLVVAKSGVDGVPAKGILHVDDGESLDAFTKAPFLSVSFTASKGVLKSSVDPKSSYQPQASLALISVYGLEHKPASVTINGHAISSEFYTYNSDLKVLTIRGVKIPLDKAFTVTYI
ncbi:lysosomal alpha-glucosidase-like [Actinia tenebrosa]|uniref:Lysosomal alpha-glucosidase-like n=1 Tax=Actinia tenebrosa TaxID=6105 RepID=A0A6P8J4W8_ACTTE|nr:lysosomal alpha-glucosidase-like [Actinia tenebrosa]